MITLPHPLSGIGGDTCNGTHDDYDGIERTDDNNLSTHDDPDSDTGDSQDAQDTPNLADTGNLADPGNDPRGDDIRGDIAGPGGDDIRGDLANPVQDEIKGAEEYIRDVGQTDAAD